MSPVVGRTVALLANIVLVIITSLQMAELITPGTTLAKALHAAVIALAMLGFRVGQTNADAAHAAGVAAGVAVGASNGDLSLPVIAAVSSHTAPPSTPTQGVPIVPASPK